MKDNNIEENKAIVLDFWKRAVGERDLRVADRYISSEYIQHSISMAPGKKGLLNALEKLKSIPPAADRAKPFTRMIADGDLVAQHMLIEMAGNKMVVLDMVRVADGLICEHWDAIQIIPASADSMKIIDGPVEITDRASTSSSRALITDFISVITSPDAKQIEMFVDTNVVEHHPHYGNGAGEFTKLLINSKIESVLQVLAEGEFAMTQSVGRLDGSKCMFYDIYRLSHSKIAEHWRVQQKIPTDFL